MKLIPIVRIGLSVLYSENKISVCRKGLPKIFELNMKLSYPNEEYTNNPHNVNNFLTDPISKELEKNPLNSKNTEFSIYKILKPNGIETHISYIEKNDSWLVAIKNSSIIFHNSSEIENYHLKKYFF